MPGEIAAVAQAVASRKVRAVDVVNFALQRIDQLNPGLNAVVALYEQAHAQADRTDELVARGEHPGPLAGVPTLVKDLEDVAGMVTTQGSRLFADRPAATTSATVPSRLTAAGAVIVGKTNLPEFATEGYTANLLFGPTSNPWATGYSPGGSSGGSAAALAAGMVPIATATDGGGSIRIPAAFCGLVGLKPTNGVVGRWPAPDWLDFSTEGPFATTVADLRLLWQVMAGPIPGDPTGVPRATAASPMSISGHPRVFVTERFGSTAALPQSIQELFDSAVQNMSSMLAVTPVMVDPTNLFDGDNPDTDWFTVATAEHVARFGREWVRDALGDMHPAAREFMEFGLAVEIDDYLSARRRRYDMVRALDLLLGDDGVLLSPTVAESGWLADGRLEESGEAGMLPPDVFNTAVQNITGHPSMSLPAGVAINGVPFGLQVTGPRYRDTMLLDLAEAWERVHPWPLTAPGYEPLTAALGLTDTSG